LHASQAYLLHVRAGVRAGARGALLPGMPNDTILVCSLGPSGRTDWD